MRGARLQAIAAAITVLHCSSGVKDFGGPTLYWNADLRRLDAPALGRFVAVIPGFKEVELVSPRGDGYEATRIVPPHGRGCTAYPITAAAVDVDGDRRDDVLVFDPGCGNWVARRRGDAEFESVAWEDALPTVRTVPYLGAFLSHQGTPVVLSADDSSITGVLGAREGWRQVPPYPGVIRLAVPVTDAFIRWPAGSDRDATVVAIQQQSHLQLASLVDDSTTWSTGARLGPIKGDDYLAPFDALDHLGEVTGSGESDGAVAIGTFAGSSRRPPRSAVFLRPIASGVDWRTIPTGNDVITVAAASLPGGDVIVGALIQAEPIVFVAALVTPDPYRAQIVARAEVEFQYRTPRSPPGYEPPFLGHTMGVKLLARPVSSDAVEFQHYDGFFVRDFAVERREQTWNVRAAKHVIHGDRDDEIWR